MNPIIRSILTPVAIAASACVLAWLFIQYQEKKSARANPASQVTVKEDVIAMRVAAIDAAKKAYKVSLEAERIAYEQEKRDTDMAELATLSHEVRVLRIELEHYTELAGIDKKFPPPRSVPNAENAPAVMPPAPEPAPAPAP